MSVQWKNSGAFKATNTFVYGCCRHVRSVEQTSNDIISYPFTRIMQHEAFTGLVIESHQRSVVHSIKRLQNVSGVRWEAQECNPILSIQIYHLEWLMADMGLQHSAWPYEWSAPTTLQTTLGQFIHFSTSHQQSHLASRRIVPSCPPQWYVF